MTLHVDDVWLIFIQNFRKKRKKLFYQNNCSFDILPKLESRKYRHIHETIAGSVVNFSLNIPGPNVFLLIIFMLWLQSWFLLPRRFKSNLNFPPLRKRILNQTCQTWMRCWSWNAELIRKWTQERQFNSYLVRLSRLRPFLWPFFLSSTRSVVKVCDLGVFLCESCRISVHLAIWNCWFERDKVDRREDRLCWCPWRVFPYSRRTTTTAYHDISKESLSTVRQTANANKLACLLAWGSKSWSNLVF